MSLAQPIQVLEEHQDLVQKLLPQINNILGQSHFTFHVNSAQRITSSSGTEYHFKIKSNDGELYNVIIFQPDGNKPAQVRAGSSLYKYIEILPQHNQRITGYRNTINEAYRTANSSYQIVSVQQMAEDPNKYVFKVRGSEDNKLYKVKIQRPIQARMNVAPETVPQSRIV